MDAAKPAEAGAMDAANAGASFMDEALALLNGSRLADLGPIRRKIAAVLEHQTLPEARAAWAAISEHLPEWLGIEPNSRNAWEAILISAFVDGLAGDPINQP